MSASLVGLTLLIIGDSHFVAPGSLITYLHTNLQQQGARVFTYGACGVPAGAWVAPRTVPCGVATRLGSEQLRTNRAETAQSWSIDDLVRQHRPNLLIVGIGDPMAGYSQREMPRSWITQQTHSLTERIQANQLRCIWVGPSWGTEGGPFFKNFGRVREFSEHLSAQVAPCTYIDSLALSQSGAWPTFDGQHHTPDGYQRWAQAITQQIIATPGLRAQPQPHGPSAGQPQAQQRR